MRRWLALCGLLFVLEFPVFSQTYLVAPFSNSPEGERVEWQGASVAAAIREALEAGQVRVIPADTLETVAQRLSLDTTKILTRASWMRLAGELDAEFLIDGQLAPAADSASGDIRITATVTDLTEITQYTEQASGAAESLPQVESTLAWKLLDKIAPGKTPPVEDFLEAHPPQPIAAVESYARGLLDADPEQKYSSFAQAARLAPDFVAPRLALGKLQWKNLRYRDAIQWLNAIPETDARYLEARFLIGLCRYYTGDYPAAVDEFRLVADQIQAPQIYNNIGIALFRQRLDGAVENISWAADVEPSDPDYQFNTAYVLWYSGEMDRAAGLLRGVLETNPDDDDARELLARCVRSEGPRPGDLTTEGLERLKQDFQQVLLSAR